MNYQARRNLRTLLCPFVRPMTDLDINTYTYTNSKKKLPRVVLATTRGSQPSAGEREVAKC